MGTEEPSNAVPKEVEFTVVVRKTPENQRLGMAVDIANGVCLVVDKVDGGIMEVWNEEKSGNKEQQVQPGDKVLWINGVSGDAVEMTQVCKKDDVLEMKILRTVVN